MIKRFIKGLLLAALLAFPALDAFAQSSVLQAGPATAGHAPMYSYGGGGQAVIMDSGPASGSGTNNGLNELLLITRSSGTPPYANVGTGPLYTNLCTYDGPITAAAGYHYLCLGANASGGGLITYGAGGAASTLPFKMVINGETITIGGSDWLSAIMDSQFGSAQGSVLYRNASAWTVLTPGSAGQVLSTQGAGANIQWISAAGQGTVTSVTCGTGLSGGVITSSGTCSLTSPVTVALGGTGATTLAAHGVLIGNGTGAIVVSTPGAAGTVLQSNGGAADPTWNAVAGTGTVTSVAAGTGLSASPSPITSSGTLSLAAIADGTVLANVSGGSLAPSATSALRLGIAGTTIGTLALAGNTSGVITIQPQAAAGTYNFNLPTGAGTSGQPLLSAGGGASPMTFGTLGVAAGGTGLTSGTSGGVLAFTASGTLASSGALTANNPVIGGGAGVAPSSGARSGNTTTFATTSGSLTSGNCAKFDASGNVVDNGSACAVAATLFTVQTFTGNGTWTRPANLEAVEVWVYGSGAGGAASGGGGAGGACYRRILVASLGATESVTVGAAGTATNNGNSSAFGTLCTATGGSAGQVNRGGVGGVGSSGTLNLGGGGGGGSFGPGGSAPGMFGGGGGYGDQAGAGTAGQNYGGGGGGGTSGGAGAGGVVVVFEYYSN